MGRFFLLFFIPFSLYGLYGDSQGVVHDYYSRYGGFVTFSYKSFYFMREIQDYKIKCSFNTPAINYGGEYEYFGGKLYNENVVDGFFIKNIGNGALGLKMGIDVLNISGENVYLGYKMNIWSYVNIRDSLSSGIYVRDIQNIFYEKPYTMGVNFHYKNGVFMLSGGISYVSDENINFEIRSGYYIGKEMELYGGYGTLYEDFIAGVVFYGGKLVVSDEVRFQQYLGIKESLLLSYGFGRRSENALKSDVRYDLNTITFDQLLKLKVPSDISCAIVDYRDEIGEYFDVADLRNIKGIGEGWIRENAGLFRVKYGKMDINRVSLKRFLTTPHIKKVILNRIVKYRETHIIGNMEQLKNVMGVNNKILKILKKYYKCEV